MKILVALTMVAATVLTSPLIAQESSTVVIRKNDSVINHLQLTNTPLSEAIQLAGELGRINIFVDRSSIEAAGLRLDQNVTATFRNESVSSILHQMLPEGLGTTIQGQSVIVSTRTRIDSGQPFTLPERSVRSDASLVRIQDVAVNRVMNQIMPVHMDQMPLEMAIQMVAGMTGKQVRFDRAASGYRFQRVSMHRDHATIRENLDELLEAAGLSWEIDGHFLIVSRDVD